LTTRKKNRARGPVFRVTASVAQLRSARAVRLPEVDALVSVDAEPLAPIEVLPLLVVELPVEPAVVLPLVLGLAAVLPLVALPLAPAAVLPLDGVPVLPIGVVWELCWPAPTAGSLAAGLGGVLWAMAEPAIATAARPASRPLKWIDALIFGDSL
jgi:hypothetical protein